MKIKKITLALICGFILSGCSSDNNSKHKTESEKFLALCKSKNEDFKNCVNNLEKIEQVNDFSSCFIRLTPHSEALKIKYQKRLDFNNPIIIDENQIFSPCFLQQSDQEKKDCITNLFLTAIDTGCQKLAEQLEKS